MLNLVKKLCFENSCFYVDFVGRVSHGKDIDNILRAEGCEPESDKRAATKKSRKLTKLEFSSENDSDENSEEYKMSSCVNYAFLLLIL